MTSTWVSLHTHTSYSILDGLSRIPDLIDRAQQLGMPALGISDHGSLSGVYDLWKTTQGTSVKPIIGTEFYVAPGDRGDRSPIYFGNRDRRADDVSHGAYTHMTAIAINPEGLRNLYRMQHAAYTSGYYYKPRVDLELLSQHSDGVVVTTGCMGGAVSTRLRLGQKEEAVSFAANLKDIFADRCFVEMMYHDIPGERELNAALVDLAAATSLPVLTTNDSHYTHPEDAKIHDALLCVQTKAHLSDEKRFRFPGHGFHLRSFSEMSQLPLPPEGLRNTLVVADMVESYDPVFAPRDLLPRLAPNIYDPQVNHLREMVDQGLRRLGLHQNDAYRERADYEIQIIEGKKYASYFITLADLAAFAKKNSILIGPGRGSAGGSLVAYLLGITSLDPLVHGLIFERFLNPERMAPPDIDIDIQDDRRDELIGYAVERFGAEHVAQLVTFGTIKARAAIKDANRVLGGDSTRGDKLSSLVPPSIRGRDVPLAECNRVREADPAVYKLALGLEGATRSVGKHAAGIVISPEPLRDIIPTQQGPKDALLVSSFPQDVIEAHGLIKMDLLGLRELSIISRTLDLISSQGGLGEIPLGDPAAYALLRLGDTAGVFQLESPGMIGLLRSVGPTSLEELSAVLALYRPGALDNHYHTEYARRKRSGVRKPDIHPELDEALSPILGETYGLIVYQEQVMEIARVVAGYSLGDADNLRRAMGKKKKEVLDQEFEPFSQGMIEAGYSKEAVDRLWEVLLPFSDYAFNKSHSVGYAHLSYYGANLKANYPAEYMAALLGSETDPAKILGYIRDAEKRNLKLLPPDINTSEILFTPEGDGIRYGLANIRGVGASVGEAVVSQRPYASLHDFFERAPTNVLNKGVLEALIKSGALDRFGVDRGALLEHGIEVTHVALRHRRLLQKGWHPLQQPDYQIPSATFDPLDWAQGELEVLGVQFTHPVMTLTLRRPLDEAEWRWLKTLLQNEPPTQEVGVHFGGGSFSLGIRSTPSKTLETHLRRLDIKSGSFDRAEVSHRDTPLEEKNNRTGHLYNRET